MLHIQDIYTFFCLVPLVLSKKLVNTATQKYFLHETKNAKGFKDGISRVLSSTEGYIMYPYIRRTVNVRDNGFRYQLHHD